MPPAVPDVPVPLVDVPDELVPDVPVVLVRDVEEDPLSPEVPLRPDSPDNPDSPDRPESPDSPERPLTPDEDKAEIAELFSEEIFDEERPLRPEPDNPLPLNPLFPPPDWANAAVLLMQNTLAANRITTVERTTDIIPCSSRVLRLPPVRPDTSHTVIGRPGTNTNAATDSVRSLQHTVTVSGRPAGGPPREVQLGTP